MTTDALLPFRILSWVNWIAQDSTGSWRGYSVEPLRNETGWYENELGRYVWLGESDPNDWQRSLQKISKQDN